MAKRQNWSSRRRKSAGLAQLPTRGARGNIPFARGGVAWGLGVWILGLKSALALCVDYNISDT